MHSYKVSLSFIVTAEDEMHAMEQFLDLADDSDNLPNEITQLD